MPDRESEKRTRETRVDPRLREAGWSNVPFEPGKDLASRTNHAVTEYPTAAGPADYALCVDGRVLGIVEAKKVSLGPQGVLTQALRYGKGMAGGSFDFEGCRVPFLYSTNGEAVWFQDVRNELNVARRVAGFHTPAALREMLSRDLDRARAWFEPGFLRGHDVGTWCVMPAVV